MIPCVRHGVRGAGDPALLAIVEDLATRSLPAADALLSLYAQEDGEIWATWASEEAREAYSCYLSPSLSEGGNRFRHLVGLTEDYDYQEDVPPAD